MAATVLRPMRSNDKLRPAAQAHIRSEDRIRVVEIGNYQIELRKIIDQITGKRAASSKKPRQGSRLDRVHLVHQSPGHGQLNDVGITQHLELRLVKTRA